jgi:DNA polymerase V
MGIPMGVPYFQIKDTLKKADATTFSSNFTLYRDISRRVFSVMRDEVETVEQYSIDEAFFALSDLSEEVIHRLKNTIEKQVGIPVSIGVANTKTQAKYASKLAKKSGGVKVLKPADWDVLVSAIPLRAIWGVGGKLELKYAQFGIRTVADMLAADPAVVARTFGVVGMRLRQELQGIAVFGLHQKTEPQKSIMSSRSFRTATEDLSILADAVAYHVRHAVADLRAMRQKAQVLRVMIRPSRHGDFFLRGGVKETVLPTPSDDTIEFLKTATPLLETLFEPGIPYQKAGVVLGLLSPVEIQQESLFETGRSIATASLMPIIDQLNLRQGKEVLLLGSRLRSDSWRSRAEVQSSAYTTRWSDIATATAK